jgi:prepilin-type N-terminal cleavage/methylation domain-containing protein
MIVPKKTAHLHGFSAVELLITLFIGSIFLIAGYQLWIQVVKSGNESSQFAKASNIAHDYLRRNTETACNDNTNEPLDTSELNNAEVTVTVSCPFTGSGQPATLKKIVSTVTYGSPQKEVTHVVFAE